MKKFIFRLFCRQYLRMKGHGEIISARIKSESEKTFTVCYVVYPNYMRPYIRTEILMKDDSRIIDVDGPKSKVTTDNVIALRKVA